MENNLISILSTRPLDEISLSTVPENFQIDIASFIETKNIVDSIIERDIVVAAKQNDAVVFTSMNAAEAVIDVLQTNNLHPDWKVFCLGNTTQKVLQSYFSNISFVTANSAASLAGKIIEQNILNIVFFCGNIRRDELPVLLKQNTISVEEIVVYETIQSNKSITKAYDGILFFSPSAVNSFFSDNQLSKQTVVFAIGETTAAAIKNLCDNEIVISDFPDKERLLQQAIYYFKHSKTQA